MLLRVAVLVWLFVPEPSSQATITAESVARLAEDLSQRLRDVFESATKANEILKSYTKVAEAEVFDAQATLKSVKRQFEVYLRERAKMAWDAKVSLESRELNSSAADRAGINDPLSHDFIRYFNAKRMSDAQTIFLDGHFGGSLEVNATRDLQMRKNPNFYGVPTNSDTSAVHIPTPLYNRDPYLLERIEWSNIDQLYRRNRERLKDLSFQKFCSESGFMRYFPAAPWIFDMREADLDMFDCRSNEWFIDAATMSKNVLILLDLSGSMLGQRLEIAKLTVESILETLSDNDFFNVMAFAKSTNFMSECAADKLLQATLRNKKLILARLANLTSEGKAEYEKALVKAFTTLMNLPGVFSWRTLDELAKERDENAVDPEMVYIQLEDHVLVVPNAYIEALNKFAGNHHRMGCTDIVMLITDGAPSPFKGVFDLYNKNKRIRFFSFLVGEEAKDFGEVKWMACSNRGFMAHVTNMADVQEKVMQYVRALSRPVSRQGASIHQENAVWSGMGRERMSSEFTVHVSYPVVLDNEFMGVSSVSVPLAELAQQAHPSLLGPKSGFFVLDKNGYAMFHTQLRSIDPMTGELKPTFADMELLELSGYFSASDGTSEGGTVQTMPVVDCSSAEPTRWDSKALFAVENLRRVYRQQNHYLAECVDGTPLTVGLSLAGKEHTRLKRAGPLNLNRLQSAWVRDHNWRLSTRSRYCFLNDSDFEMSVEDGLREYLKQMHATGEWPELCRARRRLVERVLVDVEASADLSSLWDQGWKKNQANGVHLVFFSTPAGLIRFLNQSLDDIYYEHPEGGAENNTELVYKHFVLDFNHSRTEADYAKRAVRQRGKIVFDINRQTRLWLGNPEPSAYGNEENETLLGLAYKALYLDDALVGVVGMEFLYEKLAGWMKSLGCTPNDDSTRCYLLDEHAYVVYTSQGDTSYSDFVKVHMPDELSELNQTVRLHTKRRRGPHRLFLTPQQQKHGQRRLKEKLPDIVLGSFFGHINRVAEWTMELLVKKGFYTEETFIDNQAMCDPEPPPQNVVAASASAIMRPLNGVFRVVAGAMWSLMRLISYYSLLTPEQYLHAYKGADTEAQLVSKLSTESGKRFPCRMRSTYYIADADKSGRQGASLLEENYSERPCKHNAAQCAVKVFASWVESTNLLLVVVKQGARSQCYDPRHCAMSSPPRLSFGFERIDLPQGGARPAPSTTPASGEEGAPTSSPADEQGDESSTALNSGSVCLSTLPKGRKVVVQCLRDDYLETEAEDSCSGGPSPIAAGSCLILFSVLTSLLLSNHRHLLLIHIQ